MDPFLFFLSKLTWENYRAHSADKDIKAIAKIHETTTI
jgi:hypothetical protein